MIYYRVLIGIDGFTREDETMHKEDTLPRKVVIRVSDQLTRIVENYETIKIDDRKFYLITTFYAAGKNFAVYKEV